VASLILAYGPPSRIREYHQNEIARFAPSVGHGVGQLLGETVLLMLVAYIGRKWLRL
jgi:hypothetical protein